MFCAGAVRQQFDFSRSLRAADAGARHGLQILWSLMHYSTPADVSLIQRIATRDGDEARWQPEVLAGKPGLHVERLRLMVVTGDQARQAAD